MKMPSFLKEIWDTLTSDNTPFSPAPEVQKELESLGYTFKAVVCVYPGVPVSSYSVKTPDGRTVGGSMFRDEAYQEYFEDFQRISEQYEARKKTQNPPAP